MIPRSNLRVIVLLGLRAQKDILFVFKNTTRAQSVHHEQTLSGPYQLPLQGCTVCVWILSHDRQVSRMLIAGPEPPNIDSEGKFDNAKLTATRDTFGLAAAVSGERIRHTFWDGACFFASLFYKPGSRMRVYWNLSHQTTWLRSSEIGCPTRTSPMRISRQSSKSPGA